MTDRLEPSRRDFLAVSAAGLLGLARGAADLQADQERDRGELLYVGTYTDANRSDGIYLVRMDPRSGELRQVGSVNAGQNPSFLAIHPSGRVLYAVNEVDEHDGKKTGAVSAFALARDTGAMTRLGEESSGELRPLSRSLDRSAHRVPPLRPRAVVVLDVREPEKIL